jgi:hypothetical protein
LDQDVGIHGGGQLMVLGMMTQAMLNLIISSDRSLHRWSKTLLSKAKVELHMALEIILRLDVAQDNRTLSNEETEIQTRLKISEIGLAGLTKQGSGNL